MRVVIPLAQRYVYPDVTVACGTSRFEDEHEDTLTNPTLIFDVITDRLAVTKLISIQCTLSVEDIYEKVTLDHQEDAAEEED